MSANPGVAPTRGDDGAEPGLGDGPDRVLPAGPAPEVLARDQDGRSRRLRAVQREIGDRLAVLLLDVHEQQLAVAHALDLLQITGRDDGVRIHVGAVKGNELPGMLDKRLHVLGSRDSHRRGRRGRGEGELDTDEHGKSTDRHGWDREGRKTISPSLCFFSAPQCLRGEFRSSLRSLRLCGEIKISSD